MDDVHGFVHTAIRSTPNSDDLIFENIKPVSFIARDTASPTSLPDAPTLPATLDYSPMLKSPRNQGSRGTCVAFACSALKEYQELKNLNLVSYFSPEYIYWFRENKNAAPPLGPDGMEGRDAMQILMTQGSVPEFELPYSDPAVNILDATITSLATIGSNFKTQSFALVMTVDGVKQALVQYGPCLILFPVFATTPQFWRKASATDTIRGNHGVAIVGYTTDSFIIRNSWGPTWNGDGYVLFPFVEFGIQWEIWSCVDAPSQPFNVPIPPDPTPTCSDVMTNLNNTLNAKCSIL